jgi:hypothetical protein
LFPICRHHFSIGFMLKKGLVQIYAGQGAREGIEY